MEGLLVFYPVLIILALSLLFGEHTRQSFAFTAIWLVLLAISEFFFIDDIYGGKFERFNTVLKWWAWIYSGTLLMVGALNLRSPSRICRGVTAVVLVVICAYTYDLADNFYGPPKPHLGELDGAAWLRDDAAQKAMLEYLATQPQSIALQRLPDRSYIPAPSLITFAGQTPFLGWANHEDIWRGYRSDIDHRYNDISAFYAGILPDPTRWLDENHIRYILWTADEGKIPQSTFDQINQQIQNRYRWNDFSVTPGSHVGLWSLAGN